MSPFRLLPVLSVLVALTGCMSKPNPPRVVITNAGRKPVKALEIQAGAVTLGRADILDGQKSETLDFLPESLQLAWTAPDGTAQKQDTHLSTHLPKNFQGAVYVQIQPDQKLKIMVDATAGAKESELPWSKPESWEGAPTIPGLNPN